MPNSEEFDVDTKLTLTRRQTKETLALLSAYPERYRWIQPHTTFDYIAPKDPAMYDLRFRVVRFRISGGYYETVYTNLDSVTFPIGTIKELYRLRWGIETSFKELKYTIGLSCLHGKKTDFLLQEVLKMLYTQTVLAFARKTTAGSTEIANQSSDRKTKQPRLANKYYSSCWSASSSTAFILPVCTETVSSFFPRKLSPRSLNTVASSKMRSSAHRSVESSLKSSRQRAGFLLLVKTMLQERRDLTLGCRWSRGRICRCPARER